ncbi:RNA-directed DNA polymerase from mobile element jockey [Brachionus plicatilis]|uniref:RNA-directed DNA polymerase from mobile element jockey n=1 Tax=Brachionus plicatilis TaxID=10195 RepID=A0A3M7SIX7_BRAPC|nr:RNA-directed DNA polymerase from mobile element jockey [Brachionus plicatilis]
MKNFFDLQRQSRLKCREKDNQTLFPTISRLAKKILGVPATSTAIERLFSKTCFILLNISAWNSYRRNDIEIPEQVQRIVSKMVPELKSKPYLERREALGWSTLEERLRRDDLIQLHKLQHGHDRVIFIIGNQKLASDGLDSPAGNTRTCH